MRGGYVTVARVLRGERTEASVSHGDAGPLKLAACQTSVALSEPRGSSRC